MKYTTLSIIGLFAFSTALINCTTSDSDGGTGGTAGTGNAGSGGTGNGGSGGTSTTGGTGGTSTSGGTGGTSTTGGTSSTGGTGGGDSCTDGGTGDCQTCQTTAQSAGGCCESEAAACGAEQDCVDFDDCITPCFDGQGNADQACLQQCATDHQTGFGIYQALVVCVVGDGQSAVGACGNVCQ
ncbi:MAG: hypothetical protein H6718_23190 [Polyangiaceae bacterium]|nr:hypothetical protein [Polyangiaceae bacterium]